MAACKVALRVAAGVLCLAGCSSGAPAATKPTMTPTVTSPSIAAGLTAPGTRLRLGKPAAVGYRPDAKHASRILVTVTKVRTGASHDLTQFRLDAQARRSRVYYVSGRVRNVGNGDLSGQRLTLYGQVSKSLVVPPVVFGSPFKPCNDQPLPHHFVKKHHARFCLVLLAPHDGRITSIQWRGPGPHDAEPISWAVR